jgi:DNA-binding LacI/PurR family transcriptional regulator
MAAIKDVAKLAGMSVAVVSKYLKNPDSVRADTKVKIETAINSLHYVPSPIARSMRTKRTGMIAVVVPSIINPFFAEMFESIRQACNLKSILAILLTAENQPEMGQTIQSIISRQVDGVVLCFPDQENFLKELKEKAPNLPLAIMTWHGLDENIGNIVLDVRKGIFEATSHLLSLGCKEIGYIGGSAESVVSREKFKGFMAALDNESATKNENSSPKSIMQHDSNVNQHEKAQVHSQNIRHGKATMRFGHDAMKEIYESNPSIQAIVCENDALAIGCITYCLHKHIEIPGQIMITGFDDIPLAAMFEPPITTVRLPVDVMGQCAVDMIKSQIEGNPAKVAKIFETELIVRGTTC